MISNSEQKLLHKKKEYTTNKNKLQLAHTCNELAEYYMRGGSLEKAKNEYEFASKLYKDLGKPISFAQANRMIGEVCTALAEFDEALKYEQIHLDIAEKHNNAQEIQRALASIGRTYLVKAISDPDKIDTDSLNLAYSSFLKSLATCDSIKNIKSSELLDMKARLYLNIGVVKEHSQNFEESQKYMKKSIELCKKGELYDLLHHTYYTLGDLLVKTKNYKDAITNFNYALEVGSRLSDKIPALCTTYLAKAQVLMKLREFSSAKEVLIRAYKLRSPNVAEEAVIESNLKVVAAICKAEDELIVTPITDYKKRKQLYEKMGDGAVYLKCFEHAIHYYEKMLECAITAGEKGPDLLPVYISLAQTYKDNNQFKMAYEYFQKEYEISRTNPNESYLSLLNMAEILNLLNRPYQSIADIFIKARKDVQLTKNITGERKVLTHFVNYLKKNKKPYAALEEELNNLGGYESDSESEDDTPNIGDDLTLDEIIGASNDESTTKSLPQKRKRGKQRKINTNIKGETPLHQACIKGELLVVKNLVEGNHPINVRDNCGWLPLHEACNHGRTEIVKYLINKGANVNDRGGTKCEGVTPLHDACANGCLEVIEVLLQNGASPIAITDDGDTPLDCLTAWKDRQTSLSPQMTLFYNSISSKLKISLEKVGRTTRNSPIKLSQNPDLRYKIDVEPSCSKTVKRNLSSEACNEYKRAIDGLKHKTTETKHRIAKKSALLSESDDDDNWLEDDLDQKPKKRNKQSVRKTQKYSSSSEQETDACNEYKRAMDALKPKHRITNLLSDSDSDDINKKRKIRRTNSNYSNPEQENIEPNTANKKNKTSQSSLLDSGFVRTQNDSPTNFNAVTQVDKITNKSYKRQQKLNNFVNNSSTFEQLSISDSFPVARPPMLAVNVKIENKLFRIPIVSNEMNNLTIEWLATEAAKRYYKQEGISPSLQLLTKDGAILINEDPLSMVFISETQAEEIHSYIVSWNLPALPKRYMEACYCMKIDPCLILKKSLQDCEGTRHLKLIDLKRIQFPAFFRALNRQNNLQHLELTDIKLLNDGVKQLSCVLPSLIQLRSLNLAGNNITEEGLQFLSETNILPNLDDLNLSFNIFEADTLQYLSVITQKLKLRVLNLCGCNLPPKIFSNQQIELNFKYLEHFNISLNDLNTNDVIKFMSYLNFSIISNLNVSQNANVKEGGITKAIVDKLRQCDTYNIKTLNLSMCHVLDTEIWDLLRVLTRQQELESLELSQNEDLTAVSLRRILQHRPSFSSLTLLGCKNILKYFNTFSFTSDPSNENTQKNTLRTMQISINYIKNSVEADIFVKMWQKEWGAKARVKKVLGKQLYFTVEE